jgi:thioredoxin 2
MASGLIRCGHCGQANRVPPATAGTPRCGKGHQPRPWIADADDTTFGEVAEAAKIPVLAGLRAPWCGPCRMVSPALEQLARDLAGKVKLVKVNAGTSPQISQRFGAQAISTLLVLRRGQVAARQTGAVPWPPCGPGPAMRSPPPAEHGWPLAAPRAAQPGRCRCRRTAHGSS